MNTSEEGLNLHYGEEILLDCRVVEVGSAHKVPDVTMG